VPSTAAGEPSSSGSSTVPSTPERQRRWWRSSLVWTAIGTIAAVLGTVVAVLTYFSSPDHSGNAASSPPPASSAPGATTAPPPAHPSTPPTATGAPTGSEYLPELFVDSDSAASTGSARSGTFSTNGIEYPHSIQTTAGCFNDDGGDFWADYDLGRNFRTFTATVGLRDDCDADESVTWRVEADGVAIASGAARLGESQELELDVDGVLRLRLLMNEPDAPRKSCLGDRLWLVWGAATVA
jgi:hypothetical protein